MSANAYADFVLSLSPIVYYKCDETSGTAITDYGPHGFDATQSGTALANVTTGIGQFDSLLDFNGTDQIVTLPTTQLNSLIEVVLAQLNYAGVFTINFWAGWDDFGGGVRGGIFGNMWDANDGDGFGVFFDDSGATDGLAWRVSGGLSSTGITFTSVMADTDLHMYTMVADGTNLVLYSDGVSGGSGAVPVRQGFVDADAVSIGAIESNGSTDYFDGRLGQISVHPRALTQAEITALYNLGTNARTVGGNTSLNAAAVEHLIYAVDLVDGRTVASQTADVSGDFSFDVSTDNPVYILDLDDYGSDWTLSTAYVLDDRVHPSTPNGYYYVCTTAGTSDTTEPTWTTTGTVSDNTAVWTPAEYPRPRIHGPIKVD